jgi:AcrR family transcriptional regulator
MTAAVETPAAPKRGRPAANREKLLNAALQCLGTKGYANTTARDLVEASGTNLASIGYHFGSKEALLNEAIARSMALWTASIEQEMFAAESATLEERIELALAAMLDRFGELEPFLTSFVESFPPAMRSDELRATMGAGYEHVRAAGSAVFQRAFEEQGDSIGARDAEVLTSLLMAVCDGLFLQWILDPGRTPSSREVMTALKAAAPALART